MNIGDRVRLSPTTPNIRLHNRVGEAVGTIVADDAFKAWMVQFNVREGDSLYVVAPVHEHEIELADDGD